jgi:hypothetical protein
VEASGTAAADTGVGTEAGTEAEATDVVSAVDAERLAARLGAAVAAGAATEAGAATTTGVATTAGVAVFLVTVFLETAAEELMFVLVAGIEFICLKRTDYHSGGQKQSIFIKIVSKNLQFQEKNLFFLKTGHIYDLF